MTPIEVMKEVFNQYNKEKFNNKIPQYKIEYRKMRSFGRIIFTKKIIRLNPNYTYESMCNTLLHELCHAEIYRTKNKAIGHTKKFWKLFQSKGGIITEINKQIFKKANIES